ncbi:MAG: Crp/Fnr family transcriptional regulator [Actinomycetota bacterium]
MSEQTVALLAQNELFAHLDREALFKLAERAERRTYKKGEFVFRQGDPGESLFVLLDGVAKVVVGSEQGDEMVLVTLQASDSFGELAVVDGRPRSASVEVLEPAIALVIDRKTLVSLVDEHPSVAEGLLRSLGTVLRRLTDQASDFVFLDLHGRVAKLLIGFAEAHGEATDEGVLLDLHLTQGDLARMVGGSRQRINQILGSFANRGYLELRGRQIMLKRLPILRRRAGV